MCLSIILPMTRVARLVLLLLLARWSWLFLVWPMRQDVIGASFLHLVSLPFHEAGHVILAPFGRFVSVLGGSLFQVLVPVACWIAFSTRHPDPWGRVVSAWWTGQNACDVALYVNDARALRLVLLGGRTGAEVEGHDWEYLLGRLGLLAQDHRLAWVLHALGALLMLLALAWGVRLLLAGDEATDPSW
ncbi:hypothetical protein TBR22_A01650 [Luteitalea sp. TBR-22]|nr:hypothetical protein TBR22_A01650 [Luteitalea sp. TBR-22]